VQHDFLRGKKFFHIVKNRDWAKKNRRKGVGFSLNVR